MTDLLSNLNFSDADWRPLADRMRPVSFEHYAGQQHLLGKGKPLREAIENDRLHSMLFWGPPGTGKTTLARLIAHYCGARFVTISAVLAGVKDIREAVASARSTREMYNQSTVLFVDEVHRFNKAQQDAFLPHIEDGTIFFVGATTENPSFELNNALLSRVRTYVLKGLEGDDIKAVVNRALTEDAQLRARKLTIDDEALELLVMSVDGDGRRALNWLEIAADLVEDGVILDSRVIRNVAQESMRRFDKGGDVFYEQISALHKSVRGSKPDAGLYWFCRMIDGGCDPLYIARRVVRMASEDIGNADPRALEISMHAWQAYERLGSPEGELAIAQAIVYLACAPKSNAVYRAYKQAMRDVKSSSSQSEVPVHLRNAPTTMMKELDYGKEYRYAHDEAHGYAAGEAYFPKEMGERVYYEPVDRGLEKKIREKLEWLASLDQQARHK